MKVMSQAKSSKSLNNGMFNFKIQLLYLIKYKYLFSVQLYWVLYFVGQTMGISAIKVRINAFKFVLDLELNNLISIYFRSIKAATVLTLTLCL